ncbi:MAG: DUF1638 domain-containing protein [Ruminiclostridium sp.]|nr:DUF1638 domain-containing protein [Ruminiclostridium sp.]
MRCKLICCEVFRQEICKELSESLNAVFPVFTEIMSHNYPDLLRKQIQQEIDRTGPVNFDYVLLGYGLCGNAINGIYARAVPIVIPRAHDCCTILLGSKEAYQTYFSHRPSCQWTSGGNIKSGDISLRDNELHSFHDLKISYKDLIEKYGEDNAIYIIESLTPKDSSENQMVFIQTPPYDELNYKEIVEKEAEKKGCQFELIEGNTRLLRMLINGKWPEEEFLVIPPGFHVEAVYDPVQVIKAEK